MNLPLIVGPEAANEIAESASWYEQCNPAARLEFMRAVERALVSIEGHPNRYQTVYKKVRRVLVDGFPYSLFYEIGDERILVISCFHTSRNPKIWRQRSQ